jgi:prepilin-type N-terminal cleavage/methylation domain-containing protein
MNIRRIVQCQAGFSFVELAVAVGIVGILAATAIPQISSYRKRAYEAEVKADLMNAVTAEEAYFTKNQTYKAGALDSGTPTGYYRSANVTVTSTVGTHTFLLSASHTNCGSNTWSYASTTGQITGNSCP